MKATLEGTTLRLAFSGDIISTNVDELRTNLLSQIDSNPTATYVIGDVAACKIIDSRGLNLLIALYRECDRRKLGFSIENPSPDIYRLLSFLNLTERFGLKPV